MYVFWTLKLWCDWITQWLVDAAMFCYRNYWLEGIGQYFGALSDFTATLSAGFFDLYHWSEGLIFQVNNALTEGRLFALIASYFPTLTGVITWFSYWWQNVNAAVSSWWAGQSVAVHNWIDAAKDEAIALIKDGLSLEWFSSWWGNTTTSFSDWWTATRTDVLNAVDIVVTPVRDQVNQHQQLISLLTDPGDTALRWLMDRIETALARMW